MIKVKYNKKDYVFVTKRSCWVSDTNKVISSSAKQEALRQLAIEAGHTGIDFEKPDSEMEQYMRLIESSKESDAEVVEVESKKEIKKRNSRLKNPSAVSLTSILKSKE